MKDTSAEGVLLHPGNAVLRRAIQENIVSFPSQVPALFKQNGSDLQWRIVVLFLVRGWRMSEIGERVGLPVSRVAVIIREWSQRAFAMGFIQVIDPEKFSELAGAQEYIKADLEALAAPEEDPMLDSLDATLRLCAGRVGPFWSHLTEALGSLRLAVAAAGGDPAWTISEHRLPSVAHHVPGRVV